jgi:formate dehydrogenase major subunit
MVNLTIDGKNLEVQEGITLLRAAQSAGIEIPVLCDHPELTPYGGCRLCLVEVDGYRTLQPSCTLPVSPNMVVRTNTEKVKNARKFVLTLIFSERNHFCPFCQVSGGDCELQNAAYAEGMTHWPLQPNYSPYPVDASHPYIVMENNRCILCRRCVRACGELVGNFTLGFEERGARSMLVADLGVPLGGSSCISCGVCVQVCPTGALIDRWSAYRGRETQVETTKTICVACSVGCGIEVLTRDNNLVRIEGNWDAEVNDGVICEFGRFTPMAEDRSRLVTPLVRKNGQLKAATWEDAIAAAAAQLKGPGVAALASTRLPAEALYAFKQTFEKAGVEVVTSLEEGVATSASAAHAETLGKPFESTLTAVDQADAVLVIGADLVSDHQVAGFFVKRLLPSGVKLIVAEGKADGLHPLADTSLAILKGTAQDAAEGLMAALTGHSTAAAVAKTGISAEAFIQAAGLLSGAKAPVIIYGKELSAGGLTAVVEIGKQVKAALVNVRGAANSLVAAQYGLDKPFALKNAKAVLVALADEVPSQRQLQKFEGIPFKVVLASHASALTSQADVVLPVEMWTEQEGHYLNLSGQLLEAHKALKAVDSVWSSQAVFEALAAKLGVKVDGKWKAELTKRTAAVAIKA